MQPETKFKQKVLKRLKDDFPMAHVTKLQQVSKVGDPDILICWRGWYIAWELKVGDNDVTTLQRYKLEAVNIAGGIARIVRPENLEECLEELRCLPCLSEERVARFQFQSQLNNQRRSLKNQNN